MSFFSRRSSVPKCGAIIVAAGNASRMEGIDKIIAPIGGVPVIVRTVSIFQNCTDISEIVIVTRKDLLLPIGELCNKNKFKKVTKVVVGGEDRSHSVENGLKELSDKVEFIAIHDGARPFLSAQILSTTITAAQKNGAAAPAVPVKDTIKVAEQSVVKETPDRAQLFAVQTPQIFDADLIRGALHYCISTNIPLTDDCSAVEKIGKKVFLTEGEYQNIKITTPYDLLVGEAIIHASMQNENRSGL